MIENMDQTNLKYGNVTETVYYKFFVVVFLTQLYVQLVNWFFCIKCCFSLNSFNDVTKDFCPNFVFVFLLISRGGIPKILTASCVKIEGN